MAQSRHTYVEKAFAPDIRPNARETLFPGPDNTFRVAYFGAVVALRRVTRLFLDGREVLDDTWGPFDASVTDTAHEELNNCMDRRARALAKEWGRNNTPLPIGSRWQSARQLMDGPKPIGFLEGDVPARHVPLLVCAADLLHTNSRIKGPHDFTVYIDTDTMAGRSLDAYNLIGVGQGQGTNAEPDWLAFEELATYAVNTYEAVYEAAEPEEAFRVATGAMRRAF